MIIRFLAGLLVAAAAFGQSFATGGDQRLESYIAEALENHPGIRESFSRYNAARQRLPQVSALPDPVLGVTQYVRSPETRVGPQTTMFGISQKFPWFGKRADKEKIAAKEAAVVGQRHEAVKAEVARRLKIAYYNLAYLDQATAVTGEDLELLRHYETLARARYSQGAGLQQAVIKLQAEITRDHSRLETLRRQRVDAESVLNALMDRRVDRPLPKVEFAGRPSVRLELDKLYAAARERRPEIQAAFLQIEREEKRIRLARRQGWPDVTVGAGFVNVAGRSDLIASAPLPPGEGKNIYNFSVGVNLPIFRRKYNAGVLEATETFLASKQRYRGLANEIDVSIRSIGYRIETLDQQISLFESALLPQAGQALRSSESAYVTGMVSVLELLDSERVLLEVRLGLARLRADYMNALAEMERAIGSAFPEETS